LGVGDGGEGECTWAWDGSFISFQASLRGF
jgi:hypothetical protein